MNRVIVVRGSWQPDRCAKLRAPAGGAVAQLGARLDGIEEVVGSNPIGSTKLVFATFVYNGVANVNTIPGR